MGEPDRAPCGSEYCGFYGGECGCPVDDPCATAAAEMRGRDWAIALLRDSDAVQAWQSEQERRTKHRPTITQLTAAEFLAAHREDQT